MFNNKNLCAHYFSEKLEINDFFYYLHNTVLVKEVTYFIIKVSLKVTFGFTTISTVFQQSNLDVSKVFNNWHTHNKGLE